MDIIKLSQFPNVPTTGSAQLLSDDLRGRSVHALCFKLGGGSFTKAMITALSIRMDGKDICPPISGTNLQLLNSYDGLANDAAYLFYFFGEPTAHTVRGQHLGDLDLSLYNKPLEIKVDIVGATTPTLECIAWTGVPKLDMQIGYTQVDALQIRALVRSIIQPSGAVTRAAYGVNWGSQNGGRIRQVNYLHTNLTAVEYKKNSLTKHDNLSIADNASFQKAYARVPQTGLYVLDRVVDGNQGEAETTVAPDGSAWNHQFLITTSAADTINVYADVHAAWPLL